MLNEIAGLFGSFVKPSQSNIDDANSLYLHETHGEITTRFATLFPHSERFESNLKLTHHDGILIFTIHDHKFGINIRWNVYLGGTYESIEQTIDVAYFRIDSAIKKAYGKIPAIPVLEKLNELIKQAPEFVKAFREKRIEEIKSKNRFPDLIKISPTVRKIQASQHDDAIVFEDGIVRKFVVGMFCTNKVNYILYAANKDIKGDNLLFAIDGYYMTIEKGILEFDSEADIIFFEHIIESFIGGKIPNHYYIHNRHKVKE